MMQLLVIIHTCIKATSGISRFFFHYLEETVFIHLSFIKIVIPNQSIRSWSSN